MTTETIASTAEEEYAAFLAVATPDELRRAACEIESNPDLSVAAARIIPLLRSLADQRQAVYQKAGIACGTRASV